MTPAAFALVLSVALTVTSQALQKTVADRSREAVVPAWRFYAGEPLFWAAMIALGLAMLAWLVVLHGMEVSRAYSFLSVNYVLMLVLARVVFREAVPPSRWIGVLFIVGGLWLLAHT